MAIFNKYNDIFVKKNIGELGLDFFRQTGHLYCDAIIDYDVNVVDILKRKTNNSLFANEVLPEEIEKVKQVAYLGELKNEFDYLNKNQSIAYFALEIEEHFANIKTTIFEIQKILMRGDITHIIILYKVNDAFVVSYAYRVIGDNSKVVYSDWITDDVSAELVMDKISAWYFSFDNIGRFVYDLRTALRKEPPISALSHNYISYEIFPSYYEQFGFSEDNLPKSLDRKAFVGWFRNLEEEKYPDLEYNAFYLRKDDISTDDDDDDINLDELEQQLLLDLMLDEEYGDYITSDEQFTIDEDLDEEIEDALNLSDDELNTLITGLYNEINSFSLYENINKTSSDLLKDVSVINIENKIFRENKEYSSQHLNIKLVNFKQVSNNNFKCVFNIANKTAEDLLIYINDVYVNGHNLYAALTYIGDVEAKKVANISRELNVIELYGTQLTKTDKLEFNLTIFNKYYEEVLSTTNFICKIK